MDDGPLVRRQIGQRTLQGVTEGLFIRVRACREQGNRLRGQLLIIFSARAAPANLVDCQVMREANEEGALFAHVGEKARLFGELDEKFLKKIPRVRFVPGEVQQKAKKGLSMVIVQPFKLTILPPFCNCPMEMNLGP